MPQDLQIIPLVSCSSEDLTQSMDLCRRLRLLMGLNHKCLNRILSVKFVQDMAVCEIEKKHSVSLQDIIDEAALTICPISKLLIYSVFLDLLGLATYLFTITDDPDVFAMLTDCLSASLIAVDDYGYSSISLIQGLRCLPALRSNRIETRAVYGRLLLDKLASILQSMFLAHASATKERDLVRRYLSKKSTSFSPTGEELILDFAFRPSKYTLVKSDSQDQVLYRNPRIAEVQAAIDYFRGLKRDVCGETPLMQTISEGGCSDASRNTLCVDYSTTRFVARNGHTALFIAVLKNCAPAVEKLRIYEARMRLASSVTICGHLLSHITALHLAVSLHRHEIIELLAPYEAMLQDTLMHFTPLHIAAFTGDLHAIRLLLPYAAGIPDKNGWTALVWCAYLDNKCSLCELLSLEGTEKTLRLALHAATSVKSTVCSTFLNTIFAHLSMPT
ncbi:Ankyrin repeat protein 1 [Giardia duodenalis]|uniref:Ankyrin repeat protein 1 n=1 Tax=Giardia intestinalis (strain ATCC 50803 / WB clone C6) TaxID=184922 RepID=A8BDC7_GIAIC|nr:Ankyrin repeat protein 1 [Giardia intestinalis]KAE8304217.1 Ankyrin repeat protein 1 [Giardia intestinalis]|eukprot:XP_001707763.1 Protein 21.1 [Giardia lamblia ATCC 50803]